MKLNPGTYEALSLETVLAFDVETTGLDASQDEILEVGVVRMENGEVHDRFEQLCRPSVPIPHLITQLTGIQQADCDDKPALSAIIPSLTEFLKEGLIVAHNASFDFGFLSAAFRNAIPSPSPINPNRIVDTLELSRLLLPWLPNHRLETVAKYLEVSVAPVHRALADAEATALVFKAFVPLALSLNPRTVQSILRVLNGTSDGLHVFFTGVADFLKTVSSGKTKAFRKGPPNIIGKEDRNRQKLPEASFDLECIDGFFAEEGILSRSIAGYESRAPQRAMAEKIGKSFQRDEVLVAEAGTGIGKSLAYLVPAVLWATHREGGKIVVSTQTKTLQDQLFSKELPLLYKVSGRSFLAVLLKGRGNYLCLRRWLSLINHIDEKLPPSKRRHLLPLLIWAEETQTGDVEENGGFRREQTGDIWSEIHCDAVHCLGSKCEFEHGCFYQNIRRVARKADLVLINHSLLFSDLASDFSVLGEYDSLIIDEAHHIERTASRCLGKTVHLGQFRKICHSLYKSDSYESGLLATVMQVFEKQKRAGDEAVKLLESAGHCIRCVGDLWEKALLLFQGIEDRVTGKLKNPRLKLKIRIRKADDLFETLSNEVESLEHAMQTLIFHLSHIVTVFTENAEFSDSVSEDILRELEQTLLQADSLKADLGTFTHGDYENEVVWSEIIEYQGERSSVLFSAPLHIASILAESLYPHLRRGLLTSATLSVGGQFDYMLRRLGLDRVESDRVITRAFGSPFNFKEQALFLIPAYLSSPKSQTFTQEVASLLEHVLSIHARGTMVLFTSHAMLRDVYKKLQPALVNSGIRLLGQGIDGSRSSLLKLFQEDEQSVLLGTNSFWEGVDIPGSALELLVITRIPFDVPTEPWIEANMEHIERTIGNSFMQYSVPEAVVRFRQGFGRLIRSREDRGAVLFLDNRSIHTTYGALFLQSLPVEAQVCQTTDVVLEQLEHWFVSDEVIKH
jgi:predicted DnaQ family exonuclease/DinG family helicase